MSAPTTVASNWSASHNNSLDSALGLLEQCRRYVSDSPDSSDERLALVRLLARLSPAPGEGSGVKSRALGVLTESVPRMGASQVLALRNLNLAPFPDESILWDSLADWAGRAPDRAGHVPELEAVLVQATSASGAVPAWKSAILAGFDRSAGEGGPDFAAALWRWWTRHPDLVPALAGRLPDRHALEKSLAEACPPRLGAAVTEAVLSFATGRRWLSLHGAAAAAAFETSRAVERQLSVDREAGSLDGLRMVFRRARGEDVLAAALRRDDPRLVAFAADACLAEPELLAGVDPGSRTWRAIFATSIEREPSVMSAVPGPEHVVARLLELAAAGESSPSGLWKALAKTPLGDLSVHPRRPTLWRTLPAEATAPLLAATADGWLARFAVSPDSDQHPEPELRREVLVASRVGRFLDRAARGRAAEGAELFLRFHEMPEHRFLSWLDAVTSRTLSAPDAASVGRVALRRGWRRAASRIAQLVSRDGRADLRPALLESYPLLGLWDRIGLLRSGVGEIPQPTPEELWQLFEQEAVELYPKGPEDHALWNRAGGKSSALRHDGTGQQRWRAALDLLRHGGGGDVTPARLLDAMRHDYRNNDRLSWLAGQGPFQDWHHD